MEINFTVLQKVAIQEFFLGGGVCISINNIHAV